ncbi:MAG: ABC transporter ATP-binding protein [Coriobacteriales bacterium]|jgi:ABC-2 type transport system ATP-binding protein|nr:ABC transporter ATP-binding protein [Coriobacteriales bacterium]
MSVLEARGIRKRFGRVQALDGVDLNVDAGEVFGFIGPNGAGKSTAIRVLLGIIRANEGTARIFGQDVWKDAVAIHRRIAYVPGDVSLWNNLTGGEVIDLFCRLRGQREAPRRAELIERFDFDPTKKCGTYSKGNRQKVALVAAFAADAELYILDEPTSGLDPLMELVFRACVAEVKARGASVLLSSHILSEVEQLCDRISIIRQGCIIDSGSLVELRHLTRNRVVLEAASPLDGLAQLPGVYDLVVEAGTGAAAVSAAAGAAAGFSAAGAAAASTVSFHLDNAQTPALLAFLADKDVRHLSSAPPSLEELFMSHYEGR